jgi:hypothetical protein
VTGLCPLCRQDGSLEGHHPTGRIHGRPIHPKFLFRICGPCNRSQNDLWRMARVDAEEPSVEIIQRRLTMWLATWDRPLDAHQYRILVEVMADIADRIEMAA